MSSVLSQIRKNYITRFMIPHILYCADPFEPKKVDPDYEAEMTAASRNGFSVLLFAFDALVNGETAAATKNIPVSGSLITVIYRGWMLTPEQYVALYENLETKNYLLINSPQAYRNCHYLPDSLRFIDAHTPQTISEKLEDDPYFEKLIGRADVFGNGAVIVKDFVKSEKHDWETACFVPDASDKEKLRQTIENLVRLRGKYLNEGVVIRAFVELEALTVHSKSGMPLTEEYRLFFMDGELFGIYDYWEEGEYAPEKPSVKTFEAIAQTVESRFFTMDIARQQNGEFIIIELGDGQVSGLPDRLDPDVFYSRLKTVSGQS